MPEASIPLGSQQNGLQTAADLSGAAYDDLENGTIIDGYMLVAHEHDTSTGFRGQVWALLSDPTQIVFSFGGTGGDGSGSDLAGDLEADISLTNGSLPKQFSESVAFYNNYLKANAQISTVSVTGHSLGGALAEYVTEVGNKHPINGITFEAPAIEQFTGNYSTNSLIDFVDVNDPVGTFEGFNAPARTDEHVGQVVYFDTPTSQGALAITLFDSLMSSGYSLAQVAAFLDLGGPLAEDILDYHLIKDFATLLGVSLLDTTNAESAYLGGDIFKALLDYGSTNFGPNVNLAFEDADNPQQESNDSQDDGQTISFTDQNSATITWSTVENFEVIDYMTSNQAVSFSSSNGVGVAVGENETIQGFGDGADVFVGETAAYSDILDLSKFGLKDSTIESVSDGGNSEGTGNPDQGGLSISNDGQTDAAFNFERIIFGSESDNISLSEKNIPYLKEIDAGDGDDELTSSVDGLKIDLGNGNDTVTNSGNNVAILVGTGHDTIFNTGNDVTVDLGDGSDDVISSSGYNGTFVFGDGENDTLLHAGVGAIVESGNGDDTFNISNDVLITGVTSQDRIAYDGNDMFGALAWNSTQGGWAYNNYSYGVGYGLNQNGDLVIKTPGPNPAYMYVANFENGVADIFVGVASQHAYRLVGPHPNVNFVWSEFNLANAEYKVDTGTSRWPGADPLVLDLTGNGLDLIGESEVSPMFDIYQDGFAVHTGWVKPDDGLLVWNDNGTYELLGANGESGFAALAAAAGIDFDSLNSGGLGGTINGSATISSANSVFSQLYVWQDLNGNGVMDPGELESLSQAGIASINLNATAQTDDIVAGNTITATSTFTYTNGTTAQIADVSFLTDNFNSQYTGSTAVSSTAAEEPNLKGYGTLTDLRVAMTLDPSLISTVAATLPNMNVVDLDTLRNAAMNIFTAWANAVPLANTELAGGNHTDLKILITSENGIPTVTDYAYQATGTDANGNSITYWALASGNPILDADGDVIAQPNSAQFSAYETAVNTPANSEWETITGQELDFVERYCGDPITIGDGPSTPGGSLAVLGPALTAAWNALNLETVRLAMQGPLASYFAGLSYDTASDTFDVTTDEQLAPMFKAIFTAAPMDAAGATAWINSWAPIINVVEGDLAPSQGLTATYAYLFASMVAGYEASALPISITAVATALGIPSDLIYDTGTVLQAPTADANILYAAAGNQTIIGSGGPDNDIFGSNFGNDVINNQNTNQDPDILWFATLDPSEITASRSGDNLILTDNHTGAQITVLYEFVGAKPILTGQNLNPVTGVQQIVFADGTVWNFPDIMYNAALNTNGVNGTLIGATGPTVLDGDNGNTLMEGVSAGDVYLYDIGDGADTIDQNTAYILVTSPNIVSFGADITPQDVTFTRVGNSDNLTVDVNGDPNDSLTVLGQFESTFTGVFGTVNLQQISDFSFADGISYTNAQVEQLVISAEEAIPDNTIYGFDGNDVIDPGVGGNDYMSGGNGDDTYIYGTGYGNDTISTGFTNILSGGNDTVLFNADVNPDDVTFTRSGNSQNLVIEFNNDPGDTLTVLDQFESTFTGVFGTINFGQIDDFQFADGVSYTPAQIEQMVIAAAEAIPKNTIYGFDGNDVFDPGVGGNDYMSGGNGNDTYIFGLGYGNDTIYDGSNNILSPRNDTILFGPGIEPSDVKVERDGGSTNVTLALPDGSTLTILDQFDSINTGVFGVITFNTIFNFEFEDDPGLDWSASSLQQLAIAAQTAVPDGAIYGFWTNDYIDPGVGGNHLMAGDGGSDTYVFGLGYGHDTIEDSGNGTSTVLFNADVDPSTVKLIEGSNDQDLTILLADGSELDIVGQFSYDSGLVTSFTSEIGDFQFQDASNTSWTSAELQTLLISQEEQQPSSTITAFYGNSTLSGASGNDTLIGQNGTTTFLFGRGYGNEVVSLVDNRYYWTPRAVGVISFGPGILPSDVRFVAGLTPGSEVIQIAGDPNDNLIINNFGELLSPDWADSILSGFQFSDGTFWSAAEITNILETNALDGELAVQNSTLYGPFPNNYVDPGLNGDHDIVSAGGNNTYVFGLGYGDDTIQDSSQGGSEILFNADVNPATVKFLRGGINCDNLTIVLADGSELDIENQFLYTDVGIPGAKLINDVGDFQFQDSLNTSISLGQIENELIYDEESVPDSTIYSFLGGDTLDGKNDTFFGVNGVNTVLFGIGDGDEFLGLFDDGYAWTERARANVVFGSGVDESSITIFTDGSSGNLTIQINGTSDRLTIENASSLLGQSLLSFQFADGTSWNSATITSMAAASPYSALTWYGSQTNKNLVGSKFAPNIFYLAPAGDIVTFGPFQNTVDYGVGDGPVAIDANGSTGTIVMGAGITASDLYFQSDAAGDLTIGLLGSNSEPTDDYIVAPGVLNIYNYHGWNFTTNIETIQFADGSSLAITGFLVDTWFASATEMNLVGSNFSANLFELAPGGDSVTFGQGIGGGSSNQNIVDYDMADGAVWIDPNGGSGTIVMGAGITASDVYFESDAAGDLTIGLLGANGEPTGDSIFTPGALNIYYSWGSWYFSSSIGEVQFADGSVLGINGFLTDTWFGSATDTNLTGSNFAANLFELAPGGDSVTFGHGHAGQSSTQDIVDYGVGDGAAKINPNGSTGAIVMGAGITASDLYFQSDAAGDLTIGLLGANGEPTGDSIFTPGALNIYYSWGSWYFSSSIGEVQFADGSVLGINGFLTDTWFGSATDTNLTGSNFAANLFDLAPGGDSVTFGYDSGGQSSGQNIVEYDVGDGAVSINTNGSGGTIVIGSGITSSDVYFQSDAAGDLTIGLLGSNDEPSGDSIFISGALNIYSFWGSSYFSSSIGEVQFGDGSSVGINGSLTDTWFASATNTTLVGSHFAGNLFELAPGGDSVTFGYADLGQSSGQNVADYNIGDGAVTINTAGAGGNIVMGAGITESDLYFQSDADGDLTIGLLGSNDEPSGDSIFVSGALNIYSFWGSSYFSSSIGEVRFSDGSALVFNGSLTDTWFGSATNTTLVGSHFAGNLFELAPGGDSVTFGYADLGQSSGRNVVDYNTGDGAVTVNTNGASGGFQLGAGITGSNLSAQLNQDGSVLITLLNSEGMTTGDRISVSNIYSISYIDFNNGQAYNLYGNLTILGTSENDRLYAWQSGDTLDGGLGNDYLQGSSGSNTFVYKEGYGDDYVWVYNIGNYSSRILMGPGITASDLTFDRAGGGDYNWDLQINVAGAGYIQISGELAYRNIQEIDFADGSTMSLMGSLTYTGTPGNDDMVAWQSGDTLDGGLGNDFLQGCSGSNTFVYGLGYGNDYIDAYNMDNSGSQILMGPGITQSDVTFSRAGGGPNWDLLISVAGAGSIQIGAQLAARPISDIVFSDGSTISLMGSLTYTGTPGNDNLIAWQSGDTLDGGLGNDYLQGSSGSNTFVYKLGYGYDYINDTGSGSGGSTIAMGPGITASGLTFIRLGDSNAVDLGISIAGAGLIQIDGELNLRPIQQIDFWNGSTMSLLGSFTFVGSFDAAWQAGDAIDPGPGNATVYGPNIVHMSGAAGANTFIYNLGYGNDYIDDMGSGDGGSTLAMGPGITASDLTFMRLSDSNALDLGIAVANAGTIQIDQELSSRPVQQIDFSNGSTMSLLGNFTFTGTSGNDSLFVWQAGDALDGLGGGDYERGAGGDDTFIFKAGYGQLEVNEYSASGGNSTAVLRLGAGINASNLEVLPDSSGDLLIGDGIAGDEIKLDNMANSSASGVGEVLLSSGTALSRGQLLNLMMIDEVPVIYGSAVSEAITDEASTTPFSWSAISDPHLGVVDSAMLTLTGTGGVTTDADGTLSGTGLTKIGTGLYTLAAATPGSLTAELEALSFKPTSHQVAPGGTVVTMIDLGVTQNGLMNASTMTSIIATALNDAPVIAGTQAGQATSDEASIQPLSAMTISDPDLGAADSAMITLTGTSGLATDADGTLSGTGLTKIGTGLYTLTAATPASLTSELEALIFTPTVHQVTPGGAVATSIALGITQNGLTSSGTATSVIATAVNDAPVITGSKVGQTTTDEATVKPLSAVTVTDVDLGVTDSAMLTLTGTGGVATDADGTLTGAGLTKIGTALYTLLATTPASLTSELEGLSFIPTAHQVTPGGTVATTLDLGITQNGLTASNTTTSVIATAVNDAPVLAGAKAAQTTTDEANLRPLAAVTVTDVDLNVADSAMITLTGTGGIATDADGTLSGAGLTKIGTGLYTLAAATPASLTSEIEALTFAPTARQVAVGQIVSTGIDFAVMQNGLTVTNSVTSVIATAVSNPIITGAIGAQAITDEASLKPFSSVLINSASTTASEMATITLTGTSGVATDADGTLSGTGLTKTGTGLYTLAATTPTSLVSEVDALSFTPTAHQVAPSGTIFTAFGLVVTQSSASTSNTLTSVIATAVNDAPVIAGAKAGQTTTDEASLKPLSAITVTDPDFGVTNSVVITLTGTGGIATDADGTLSGTGLTKTGTGLYTLAAAPPASMTSELDGLTFTPMAHQVAPGGTVVTMLDLGVTQNGLMSASTTTSIIAMAVNDAPVIAGTQAGQAMSDETILKPLAAVTVTDPDLGAADSAMITLTGTSGVATDADGALSGTGLTKIGTGLYTLTGATPASLTSEMEALSFTPMVHQVAPGGTVATSFKLSVTQNGLTSTSTATSVIATAVNDAPMIAGAKAGQTTTDEASLKPLAAVIVTDVDVSVTDSAILTLTGSVGVATDVDGTLLGTGLTKIGTGLYTLSAATPASLTSELEGLTFSPTAHQIMPGAAVPTTIDLVVTQNGVVSTNTATSIIATAVNDAPVIAGAKAAQTTTDEASLKPLSALAVTDPDFGVMDSAMITLTGTGGVATDADGTLTGTGLMKIGTGLYTLAAATPASLTSELEALTFTPKPRQVAVGQTVSTGIDLSMTQNGLTASNSVTSVIAIAASNPIITGAIGAQATTDEVSLKPFAAVLINSASASASETATITLSGTSGVATDADGTLSGAGLTKTGTGLYTLAATTPASLVSELDALSFTPTAHQVAPIGTIFTAFGLIVTQSSASTSNTLTSVIATAVNDAPVIAGAKAGQTTTDEASLKPLSAITVTDPDFGVTDSAMITLTGTGGISTDADGTLSGMGLTKIGAGLYTLAAPPASLTSELEGLTFTPTAHQVAPGGTVVTVIDLGVTQNGLTIANTTTSIIATAVNDAPVIAGIQAGQATTDEASLKPFSAVTVTDPDLGAADSAMITLTGTSGVATDADGTLSGAGLTKTGTGLYTLAAATPASLTSELEALIFTPTAHQVAPAGTIATSFKISVAQNGLTSSSTATSVIATAVNDPPVLAGAKAGQTTVDEASLKPLSAITVADVDIGVTDSAMLTLTGTGGIGTDADGTLSGTGLTKIGTGLYTLAAATPASLTSELEGLTFSPTAHQVAPGATVATTIDLVVTQNGVASTSTATSVIATAVNDAPVLAGAKAGQTTTDEASVKPLSTVAITDPDYGVTDSAMITLTGTGGVATDADGTLSGTGLTKIGTGLYTLAAATPGSLTSELEGLSFTPTARQVAVGQTVSTGIDLSMTQNGLTASNSVTSVIATAVSNPIITGAIGAQATTDELSLKPFAAVLIDSASASASETATITLSGTSGVATDADGTLSGTGLTKTGTGLYTLAATTPTSLVSELAALSFTPTAHQAAPGGTIFTAFGLVVTQSSASTSNTLTSVIATAVNDAPVIAGAKAGQTTTDEASLKPLSAVTITDPDYGATDSALITLTGTGGIATDADGTLSGTGLTKIGTGLYTLAAAPPASMTSELDGLTFTPMAHQVAPGGTVVTVLDLGVTQNGLMSASTTTSVIATAVNDAPVIAGAKAAQTTSDEASLKPLSVVTLTDVDLGVTDSAMITLAGTSGVASDADGTLSGAGVTKIGTGLYTLAAATPASLASELEALIFTPTAHQVAPGGTVVTTIALGIAQNGLTITSTASSVIATAVNDAPVITGAKAGQTTTDYVTITPFSAVTISDVDFGVTDSLTITLDNSSGVASDANGTLSGTGLTKTGTGLYTLAAASGAILTSELEGLVFTPTQHEVAAGATVASTFALAAHQIAGGTTVTTSNSITSVIVTALNYITGPAGGNTIISGTSGSDVITASGTLNTINSNGGNDFINAGSGRATVNAAGGNDIILLGGASNTVTGTNGNDTISGASGGFTNVTLGSGNDSVTLGGSGNTIVLGTGTDLVAGLSGTFYVTTGSGADIFELGASSLTSAGTISAGAGLDTISFMSAGAIGSSAFANVTGVDSIDLFSGTNTLTISDAMVANSDFQTLTVMGGPGSDVVNASGVRAGHSVMLSVGAGNSTLTGSAGNDVFGAGLGNNTFVGGGGIDTYDFAAGDGTVAVYNNSMTGGTAAAGQLDFGTGINEQDLWFLQSGNNLVIDRLGTSDQVIIENWFGTNASAQLSEIKGSDGLEIDSGLANLISAMAAFSAENSSFNPVTASQMPSNTALQSAIATSWHS